MSQRRSNSISDTTAPVALGGEVVAELNLPASWVLYPRHYGLVHGFAETEDGPFRFCACAYNAVRNAYAHAERTYHGGSMWPQPPMAPSRIAGLAGLPESDTFACPEPWAAPADDKTVWGTALCHRCNLVTPTMRWAHEMYESAFNQFHGWYTQQAAASVDFCGTGFLMPGPAAPAELVALWKGAYPIFAKVRPRPEELAPGQTREEWLAVRENTSAVNRENRSQRLAWGRLFQNQIRSEFGYRAVGDGNISESMLASLVTQVYPDDDIQRNLRPEWLDGLELDIWLPKRNLGIEYQGQQHYKAVEAWGGEEALARLQARDQAKREICAQLGVRLMEYRFDEPLTVQHLRLRLDALDLPI